MVHVLGVHPTTPAPGQGRAGAAVHHGAPEPVVHDDPVRVFADPAAVVPHPVFGDQERFPVQRRHLARTPGRRLPHVPAQVLLRLQAAHQADIQAFGQLDQPVEAPGVGLLVASKSLVRTSGHQALQVRGAVAPARSRGLSGSGHT